MQKAARHPPKDGVRQTSFLQLQAVNGGHAVVHGQEGHGAVGADKPPFIPIADDFADKLAVVLSLDVDPLGTLFPSISCSVGRAAASYHGLSAPRLYLNYATNARFVQDAFCCSLCTNRPIFWHYAQRVHNSGLLGVSTLPRMLQNSLFHEICKKMLRDSAKRV